MDTNHKPSSTKPKYFTHRAAKESSNHFYQYYSTIPSFQVQQVPTIVSYNKVYTLGTLKLTTKAQKKVKMRINTMKAYFLMWDMCQDHRGEGHYALKGWVWSPRSIGANLHICSRGMLELRRHCWKTHHLSQRSAWRVDKQTWMAQHLGGMLSNLVENFSNCQNQPIQNIRIPINLYF